MKKVQNINQKEKRKNKQKANQCSNTKKGNSIHSQGLFVVTEFEGDL